MLPILLCSPWRIHIGHGFGLRGPFLTGYIQWSHQTHFDMVATLRCLKTQIQVPERMSKALTGVTLDIHGFLRLFHELDVALGNPLSQSVKLLGTEQLGVNTSKYRVVVASQQTAATLALLKWLVRIISQAHTRDVAKLVDPNTSHLLLTAQRLSKAVNGDSVNNQRIIQAALSLEMPVKVLPRGMILVGTGRAAQIFSSTITDQTPSIGVQIAKRKSLTAHFLRMHGLPTPQHRLFDHREVEAAAKAAVDMGYPVVVKPDDLDRGIGVHAGLVNEAQVRACFVEAGTHSKQILIEQFIKGHDYRITVIDGAMVKAIGRHAGGVKGDGRRSVRQIIEQDGEAIKHKYPGREVVVLDDEALSMLKEVGRSPDDVLPAGTFLALRRRANMSTGGTSHDVRDIIHPDNVQLAIQAAQALKLDIAGIDLITPDIQRSWMDVSAAICEVNAQPQIHSDFTDDVYLNLLRQRLPGRHRLRTVLLVDLGSESIDEGEFLAVEAELLRQGESVLSITEKSMCLDGKKIAPLHINPLGAAMLAEINPSATAILLRLPITCLLENGSPWLYIDHLCLLGFNAGDVGQRSDLIQLQRIIEGHLQRPMCMHAERFVDKPDDLLDVALEQIASLRSGWPQHIATTEAFVSP